MLDEIERLQFICLIPRKMTLAAMGRIQNYYDRLSAGFSLAHAYVYLATYVLFCCMGVLKVRDYFRTHDAFSMFLGSLALLAGVIGIVHALQIIRAVVRRADRDSR